MPNKDSLREAVTATFYENVSANNPKALPVYVDLDGVIDDFVALLTSHIEEAERKRMGYDLVFLSGCCKATMTQKTLMNGKPLEHPYRWYLNKSGTGLRRGFKDTQIHYCDKCGKSTNPQNWVKSQKGGE